MICRLVYKLKSLFRRLKNKRRFDVKFTISAHSEPACKSFLKIKTTNEDEYSTIDEFIQRYPSITEAEVNECWIQYRGTEKKMSEWLDDYNKFISNLQLRSFEYHTIVNENTRISEYFINKAIECLQFARFFTIKSALILDTNFNINWASGYPSHFYIRCIYFGTACTWYQNAMDHVIQAVYWHYDLYKNVKDRNGNPFDATWNEKKIIENCAYEFVVGELKNQGQKCVRKILTNASSASEKVRKWANYIKHKGGVDYLFVEPKEPYEISIASPSINGEQRYKIENFSPKEKIDIDNELEELKNVHIALLQCIEDVITAIDYKSHALF